MAGYLLTTKDNPWDPSLEFKEWYSWDTSHGYHTLSYQARVARLSDEMSEADYEEEVERVQREILQLDPFGIYILVPELENDQPSGVKR